MENKDWVQFKIHLKEQYKAFALAILKVVGEIPNSTQGRVIAYQLAKSGTSCYANYRASLRSKAEFFSKLSICIEETDETEMWLELLKESGILNSEEVKLLHVESIELLKIVAPLRKKLDENSKNAKQ